VIAKLLLYVELLCMTPFFMQPISPLLFYACRATNFLPLVDGIYAIFWLQNRNKEVPRNTGKQKACRRVLFTDNQTSKRGACGGMLTYLLSRNLTVCVRHCNVVMQQVKFTYVYKCKTQ